MKHKPNMLRIKKTQLKGTTVKSMFKMQFVLLHKNWFAINLVMILNIWLSI